MMDQKRIQDIQDRLDQTSGEHWVFDNVSHVWDRKTLLDGHMIAELRGMQYFEHMCGMSNTQAFDQMRKNGSFVGHAKEDMAYLLSLVKEPVTLETSNLLIWGKTRSEWLFSSKEELVQALFQFGQWFHEKSR